ncbi:MAG: hypothetical protein WCC08_02290, partial [Terrimicrobiaceae bacterium]
INVNVFFSCHFFSSLLSRGNGTIAHTAVRLALRWRRRQGFPLILSSAKRASFDTATWRCRTLGEIRTWNWNVWN